eukprot:10016196-Karenia_brevis.AAC.1
MKYSEWQSKHKNIGGRTCKATKFNELCLALYEPEPPPSIQNCDPCLDVWHVWASVVRQVGA